MSEEQIAVPVSMDGWVRFDITKREYFAAAAMAGLCAHQYGPPQWNNIAKDAVHMADLLVKALESNDG